MSGKKRRAVVRWIKRGLMVGFLVAVAAMVVMAWMPKPLPVETAEVTRGELVVTVSEDGRSRVKDRYVVSAPLSGNLGRIELHPGDNVTEGGVLARIVPVATPLMDVRTREQAEARVAAATAGKKQARAQIVRAKAALEYAEQEVERIRPLVEQGIEPDSVLERMLLDMRTRAAELTSAEFAERVAGHELRMARSALGHIAPAPSAKKRAREPARGEPIQPEGEQLEVPSPIAGRVLAVIQRHEGVVPAGAPLIELGDPSALEIVVDVLTQDAVQIQHGAPATIERWGGEPLRANVRLVEPSAFTRLSSLGVEEQRVNAVLDIDQPYEEWKSLGDGYRVDAKITIWRADDVLKVPSSALFRHDEGWAVFVVRGEIATLVPVEIGRRNGLEAQVESGLEAGDRVLLHPSDRVVDGVTVAWR